jgi:hypothetical protein
MEIFLGMLLEPLLYSALILAGLLLKNLKKIHGLVHLQLLLQLQEAQAFAMLT